MLIIMMTVACVSPPPARQLELRVSNELGRDIAEIRKKPCDDLEFAYVAIDGSNLAPGERRNIILPATCVDLVAYDAYGRIVGEQRGLEMLPGATWVLRR